MPDLVLHVEEHRLVDGRLVWVYTLEGAASRRLSDSGPFRSEPFDAASRLEIRDGFWRRLVPEELRRALRTLRDAGLSLSIVSNPDRRIPWKELLLEDPEDPASGRRLGQAFSVDVRGSRPRYRGQPSAKDRSGGKSGLSLGVPPEEFEPAPPPPRGDVTRGGPKADEKRDVQVSAVVPEGVRPGARFLVEVFFHLEGYEIEASPGFQLYAQEATLALPDGTRLTLLLCPVDADTFEIDRPEADLEWDPPHRSTQFLVRAHPELEEQVHYDLRLEIWLGETQLARTYVDVRIDREAPSIRRRSRVLRRLPRRAFASYARKDRVQVRPRLSSLESVGVDVFYDCLDIEPAEDWEELLRREIGSRDCLLLFWSTAARESVWVEKEWRYALAIRGEKYIVPNALELPEHCPPPEELAHLQFGSRFDRLR